MESQLLDLKRELEILERQFAYSIEEEVTVQLKKTMLHAAKYKPMQETVKMQDVQSSVEIFLRRQNLDFVKSVFDRYAHSEQKIILANSLGQALGEFGIPFTIEEAEEVMAVMDIDQNGGLDFQEFARTLNQPSTQLEQWAETLPLAGMLSSCLATPGAGDQLRVLCDFASDGKKLKAKIDEFSLSLYSLLEAEVLKLKDMLAAMDAGINNGTCSTGSKFAAGMVGMNAGTVDEYHEGIYSRIGKNCSVGIFFLFTWT